MAGEADSPEAGPAISSSARARLMTGHQAFQARPGRARHVPDWAGMAVLRHDAECIEGRGRPQDRPDIVWIGHLIEHEQGPAVVRPRSSNSPSQTSSSGSTSAPAPDAHRPGPSAKIAKTWRQAPRRGPASSSALSAFCAPQILWTTRSGLAGANHLHAALVKRGRFGPCDERLSRPLRIPQADRNLGGLANAENHDVSFQPQYPPDGSASSAAQR